MSDNPHLSVLVEQWLVYLRHRKSRSETTIDTYRSILGFFVEFTHDCLLSELSVELVDSYAESLLKERLAPKTYRNRITPIRSFFTYLFIKDYTTIHPMKIETPPDVSEEANFLTHPEQKAMINACKNIKERALVEFMISSGVRVSELVDLETSDIHERSVIVRLGKGKKSRVTFIDHRTEATVATYHSEMPAQRYVFPNRRGGKISRQYIHRTISNIAARAKINKNVSPHTLRHTFGTSMLVKGASAEEVQKMMGHANIRTTLIYLHFTNEYLHGRYDEVNGMNPQDKAEIILTKSQVRKIKNSNTATLVLT